MASGLFSIARGALIAHQTSLQVVSHNIANAETPGYTRQRPMLQANVPVRMPFGTIGTGVQFEGTERIRDEHLDQTFRSASSLLGESRTRQTILSQIEDSFGEPSDAGMATTLDQFWSAFSDLATSPDSLSAKSVVQQRGKQLGDMLNHYDQSLTTTRVQTESRLNALVDDINGMAAQVAELNGRISSAETTGQVASDLRDQRDLLLDELSRKAGTRSVTQRDGSVSVMLVNSTLVDGTSARKLTLEPDPPVPAPAITPTDIPVKLRLGNSADRLGPLEGELRGLTDVINKDIPSLRSRLDALASSLVRTVNATHTSGYVFTGTTIPGVAAGNFFDPGTIDNPVRAGTIRLHADILSNPGNITASGDANAPLDNSIARNLAGLRNSTTALSYTGASGVSETAGFNDFFRTTVTRLGLDLRSVTDDITVRTSLVDNADARRQSVSGVNTDEELVQLMRVQQSYVAATKLIKTADEMLQTLLSLV